ncbi:MAG TPA: PglZ domain-containing protein [Thermoanaerobaculia bacterium]|nr:PglZ domain-containing protein [Thermoanaerobaculia bacterium]
MRNPLHQRIAEKIGEKLKKRRIVVWYDPSSEFAPFLDELRGETEGHKGLQAVHIGGLEVWLAEYTGSFFEVRDAVEHLVDDMVPVPVLIYVPGFERDPKSSVLMELEKAGETYQRGLRQFARDVLRKHYTDGVIDELTPDGATYQDLSRACSESVAAEPPSILKIIFHGVAGNDALLACWLADDSRDGEIEAKSARPELAKLVRARLGLEVPLDAPLAKLRALTLRYMLAGEFRWDLRCPVPDALGGVPMPTKKEELVVVRVIAELLRSSHGDKYPELSSRVETELGLAGIALPAGSLGAIDTFRFEERVLLDDCADLIAKGRYDEALGIVAEREHSFWLDRDLNRKAQWEACRLMAELGRMAEEVRAAVGKAPGDTASWIEAYTRKDGWYRLDQAQRRLETWLPGLDEDPPERPLGVVRRAYDDAISAMAEGFSRALGRSQWSVPGTLSQTHVYPDIVTARPKPAAYFLIDAMRFEMGFELAERLPKAAEVTVRPAVGSLPSITPIGMAALLPGAAGSFTIADQNGKFGARIDDAFVADLVGRRKLWVAKVAGVVDLALDELLSLPPSKLAKRIEGAPLIVVRSQEIDQAGETGFTYQARQVMDNVIDNIARAIKKLAAQGVEHSVVTADHGHLFFPLDRDESMRIDPPRGQQVSLHRRCWIGRGGATPTGCIRVTAAALGYDSDLDVIFPIGCGVFRAGGDLAYHHGGPSLQEIVIPVLGVRLKMRPEARAVQSPILASGLPSEITNRIFSVIFKLDGLFPMVVKPLLAASGKQVGAAGMVVNAEFDRETGTVTLQPGEEATIAFVLSGDESTAVRIVIQDPATDAELYRSPQDIPVRLGV